MENSESGGKERGRGSVVTRGLDRLDVVEARSVNGEVWGARHSCPALHHLPSATHTRTPTLSHHNDNTPS
eukprot:3745953-Rhodomonas_salina.1